MLSNGIIATGQHYARAEFIPIKGTQLARVVAVNQLSRDIDGGAMPLDEVERRLKAIRTMGAKPWWELVLGVSLGVGAFSILFGGSLVDAAATFSCGLLLGAFMAFVSPHLSRIFGSLVGGLVGGLLCILAVAVGFGEHLPNMIIGTIIALVPGVPFTNGMRDLANEDYLAGATRLLDAFLVFLCIALGVVVAFVVEEALTGDLMVLDAPVTDALTSAWYVQLASAFVGTVGFAALFGAPRRYYAGSGLVGMAGWAVYLLCSVWTSAFSVVGAAFAAALVITVLSHLLAVLMRAPVTVFLICGIIPLVPGGGIFWTAYYLVSNQLSLAAATGFTALKVTIAIAAGIILAAAVYVKIMRKKRINA